MKTLISFVILSLLLASSVTAQQIHKWQDEKGQWHFTQMPGRGAAPIIKVVIEKLEYRNGYLTIEGTVENISGYVVTTPSIQVQAHDAENDTVLSDSSTRGAGGYKAKLEPQKSAFFTTMLRFPGTARGRDAKINVSVEEYPFEIEWKRESRIRIW